MIEIFIGRIEDTINRKKVNHIKRANELNYMNDIIGIKSIYHTLDKESKDNIWDIMHALVYLAEERYKSINSKSC